MVTGHLNIKFRKYMKKILGIIPARGGSKSIPRKNIKHFAGKPLVAWSIEVGLKSGILDRLIVSTDDEEISNVAIKHGAEVPFLRPSHLAEDTSATLSVLQHVVDVLKEDGYYPDYVLLLEPTSPCRQDFHLQEAAKLIEETDADSVVALGEVPMHFNPDWQIKIDSEKKIELLTGAHVRHVKHRRQDLPTTYYRNGAFYLFKTDLLYSSEPTMYGNDVRAYLMDAKFSFDIDTPRDWELAENNFKSMMSDLDNNKKD